ncbi:hypothetical protein ACFQV2_05160 [Actinokineospora soli]|uniref:Uncharacterized protein n=1 Tax=Actinokineospora soli TaxID=1048753 RepID=A0ABW2TJV7_9PSEU
MRPLVLAAALAATACTASIPGMGTIPPEPPQDTALTDRLLSERDLPLGSPRPAPRASTAPSPTARSARTP